MKEGKVKVGSMKQHSDTRPGTFKSGGKRIDDHAFWAGSPSEDSVFPDGPHKCKDESSAEGFGELSRYEDTTEAVKAQQEMNKKKVHGLPRKDLHRN